MMELETGPKQWEFNGHFYFLSHTVPEYAGKRTDWLDARNLCRRHCMDSVSIETEAENEMVKQVVERGTNLFVTFHRLHLLVSPEHC